MAPFTILQVGREVPRCRPERQRRRGPRAEARVTGRRPRDLERARRVDGVRTSRFTDQKMNRLTL